MMKIPKAPTGRNKNTVISPRWGLQNLLIRYPARCAGLLHLAPLGLDVMASMVLPARELVGVIGEEGINAIRIKEMIHLFADVFELTGHR